MAAISKVVNTFYGFFVKLMGFIFQGLTADPDVASGAAVLFYRSDTKKLRLQTDDGNFFDLATTPATTATEQTTDATPTNVTLATPSVSTAKTVLLLVSACKSDGSKAANWIVEAGVRCDSGGTLTVVGTDATIPFSEFDSAFAPSVDLNVSGADIVAVLTGVALTTINWTLTWEVA